MLAARLLCLSAAILGAPTPALSHGGGLNAEGCHNDRKNGGYHCHRAPSHDSSSTRPQGLVGGRGGVAFAN